MIELKDKTSHVEYENQPDVKRNLLQNIFEMTQDQYEQLMEAIESIPEDYTQLSEDVTDLKEALSDVNADIAEIGYEKSVIDFSDYNTVYGTIQSSGKWAAFETGSNYKSTLVTGTFSKIIVTARADRNAYISFFKSVPSQPTTDVQYIDFCSGETGRHTITAGQSENFDVPADCVCIVVTTMSNGIDFTPTITSVSITGILGDIIGDIATAETTLTHKADKDGTVASAEQLLSDVGTEDKAPYLFRAVPYDSTRVDEEVVGVSVGWNQLVKTITTSGEVNDVTFTIGENGQIIVNGTPTDTVTIHVGTENYDIIKDHVYMLVGCPSGGSASTYRLFSSDNTGAFPSGNCLDDIGNGSIKKALVSSTMPSNTIAIYIYAAAGQVTNLTFLPQFIDLTAWFGKTIADYALSLETATAGSGVAFIKALLPSGYIPYSAPTLKSIEGLSAHVMRDANENIIGNYPLDSDLTLRGILKMDSDHRVYADGDVYGSDGTVTRKYGIVDLGTLTWASSSGIHYAAVSDSKVSFDGICAGYEKVSSTSALEDGAKTWSSNGGNGKNFWIKDTSKTSAEMKTAMSGVYLVYELATATTETADPYASPQNCAVGGTEEYVYAEGGSGVPVGHNSKYQKNMRSELERVSVAVPTAPSASGTYSLKATVTSSGVTYAWTSD